MATPGQLVETIGTVLGIPATTVAQYDRQLSEAGLRSKGGRGRSAAKVTAQDAAYLLIAILASPVAGPSISGAAETCQVVGALKERAKWAKREGFAEMGLVSIAALPPEHTLLEALTTLIDRWSHGEVVTFDQEGVEPPRLGHLRISGPAPWADLSLTFGEAWLPYAGEGAASPVGRDHGIGDLRQERGITFVTISAIANLIGSTSPRDRRGDDG